MSQDTRTFRDYKALTYVARDDKLTTAAGKDIHWELTDLFSQALTMWVDKVEGYGLSRYDQHDETFDVWMCFSDVYRKFIRLEQLTRDGVSTPLIDAYADMALYCISNLHVLLRHMNEGEKQ